MAIENLLANLRHTLRAQRVGRTRPAQRRLGLFIGLEQRLVRPLGLRRRILFNPIQALEYRPCARSGDCNGFLHILHWLVHVLSLSTAGIMASQASATSPWVKLQLNPANG